MKDEALKLALDRCVPSILSPGWMMIPNKDFAAIKQALSKPVQEPVAEVIALQKLENESIELTPRIIALTLDLSIGEKLYRIEK